MKTEQKKLPKSQIEITFELTAEEFKHYIEHALEHLKKHVKVDGFRPGQAPAKLVEDKIKPEALLMEAGDHAVQHSYSDYIKENNFEPVGHPEIKIKKIAKGSPFEFTAIATLLPDVELPGYKEIAKAVKSQEISVSDQEVEDSIRYLQKTRSKFSLKNSPAEKGDFVDITYQNKDINEGKEVQDKFVLGEGGLVAGFEDAILGMKDGQEKEFNVTLKDKEAAFKVKIISVQKMEVPEVNDEFAKQLGNFDTLQALKQNMKEGLLAEKTEAEKQRRRAEILEKISEKSKLDMPESMVEYEQQNLLEDLKNKISGQLNISFEQYLAAIKKTEEEIKETYKKEAEKRLRGFLVLRQIGKKENIEISDAEIEQFDNKQPKEYTKGVLFNEKVFKLLEN